MEKIINFETLKQLIQRYFIAAAQLFGLDGFTERNLVLVCGLIKELPHYSHSIMGERFYDLKVSVPRNSGVEDILPVTISERMLDIGSLALGKVISLTGQLRSYNIPLDGNRLKLVLKVFARNAALEEQDECVRYENMILLDGYLCKNTVYRTTPHGREISDIMLAVNRNCNRSDYIPTVSWGRNARYSADLTAGERLVVIGRIQSRAYEKVLESGDTETRTAYEVSVSSLAVPGQNNSSEGLQEPFPGAEAAGF